MCSAIAENEKREIKNLVLCESFKEPIPQIAIQMAVLIGNISRYDYPQDWNEVMFKYIHLMQYWFGLSHVFRLNSFCLD